MMKTFLKFSILIIAVINIISAQEERQYPSPGLLNSMLRNDKLFRGFADCILEEGPCDTITAKFKKQLPHLIHTQCAECREQTKVLVFKSLAYVRKNRPDYWGKILKKFAPSGLPKETIEMIDKYE